MTLALAPVGAVSGAALAAAVLWTIMLLQGEWSWAALNPGVLLAPCLLGALPGAVLAPAVGWVALRRVPVGRALAGCFAGGWLGGVAGSLAVVALGRRVGDIGLVAAIGGAALGVAVAAARLWRTSRRMRIGG